MALTEEGARLTELHRLLQVRLSTQAMAATRLLWSQMDPAASAAAQDAWLRQQIQLAGIFDQKSALAAADYMKKFRLVEGFSRSRKLDSLHLGGDRSRPGVDGLPASRQIGCCHRWGAEGGQSSGDGMQGRP